VVNLGAPELLIVLTMFVLVVFPIWGIIDAALRPDDVWARANQNKVVWILVQIFLSTLGALIYFLAIRPKLAAAA
jgi:nitrate/nitrite transporter NarK